MSMVIWSVCHLNIHSMLSFKLDTAQSFVELAILIELFLIGVSDIEIGSVTTNPILTKTYSSIVCDGNLNATIWN